MGSKHGTGRWGQQGTRVHGAGAQGQPRAQPHPSLGHFISPSLIKSLPLGKVKDVTRLRRLSCQQEPASLKRFLLSSSHSLEK